MDQPEKAERINISMRRSLWHAFRVACVQRKTSASREIQQFIERQLAVWVNESQKRTDHV